MNDSLQQVHSWKWNHTTGSRGWVSSAYTTRLMALDSIPAAAAIQPQNWRNSLREYPWASALSQMVRSRSLMGSLQGSVQLVRLDVRPDRLDDDACVDSYPIAQARLGPEESVRVLPFLSFTRTRNTGIAFSLVENRQAVIAVLGLAAVAWMVWHFARAGGRHPAYPAAFGLLVGGALGNLYDRLENGYVTDFVHRDRNHPSIVIESGTCEHERFNPTFARWCWL